MRRGRALLWLTEAAAAVSISTATTRAITTNRGTNRLGAVQVLESGQLCFVTIVLTKHEAKNTTKTQNTLPKHKIVNVILSGLNNGVCGRISRRSFDAAHMWVKMMTAKIFKNPNP